MAGAPAASPSTGGSPKPSSHDGSTTRQRAGVQRAEVVDPPEAPDPRRVDRHAALADDEELGLEPSLPGETEPLDEDVRGFARLERADEQEVATLRPRRVAGEARGASGTARTRSGASPHARITSPRTTSVSHSTRAARRASPRGRASRCHSRSYAVKSCGRSSHERSWTVSTNGVEPGASGRRGGRPDHVAARQQRRQSGATGHRRGAEQRPRRQRAADRHHARRHRRRPARQQHAVLVAGELARQGLEQRSRIVRHPACPAADQAAPVDPDPHARCPVTASPSTPAPPLAPSSAGSSDGRASSRRACPRCAPTATRS